MRAVWRRALLLLAIPGRRRVVVRFRAVSARRVPGAGNRWEHRRARQEVMLGPYVFLAGTRTSGPCGPIVVARVRSTQLQSERRVNDFIRSRRDHGPSVANTLQSFGAARPASKYEVDFGAGLPKVRVLARSTYVRSRYGKGLSAIGVWWDLGGYPHRDRVWRHLHRLARQRREPLSRC